VAYYAEYTHLAQLFDANGLRGALPNPRGLYRYGQAFAKAIDADWGNKVSGRHGHGRLRHCAGPGGNRTSSEWGDGRMAEFSTDFIIAQTTRFKAAISGAGPHSLLRCMDTTATSATMNTNWDSHEG